MLFAIDYDGAYSAAPALWEQFAANAQAGGHTVIICTGRAFAPTVVTTLTVYCTGGQAKADYLASLGVYPDVWIDDDPGSVTQDDAP